MDSELRQNKDAAFIHQGEEEISPEMMKVRSALLCLPRVCCSAGFEYKLKRRLDDLEKGVRPVREHRGWGMGWAGLGLGFAAALLVAVIAFDFSFTSPHLSGAGPAVTSATQPGSTTTPVVDPPQVVSSPQSPIDQQPAVATDAATEMAAAKDSNSSKNPPTNLPENLYHMVGGNNP